MKTGLVDLHLHLDGSIDLPWGYEMAIKEGVIDPNWTFEDYYTRMYRTDFETLEELFKIFDYTGDVMQNRENLITCVVNLIRRLHEQGMVYAEIRFASQLHTKKGMTQLEVLQAVIDGVKEGEKLYPDVTVRIINCLMHKGNGVAFNDKENRETVEVTRALLGDVVVALDLAGYENNCPITDYGYLFEMAREYGIPYTCHAGEMGNGAHVVDAINMGAYRIGHGVNCVDNPEWLAKVVETQIPLEVCVTSNVGEGRNYAKHQIRQLLAAGAYVTVNTDNMMFSRNDINYEHSQLRTIGISVEQLKQITLNGMNAAFCDQATKEKCIARIHEIWGE